MPAGNARFGATAAGSAELKFVAKCRRFAKPPSRCTQAGRQCGEQTIKREIERYDKI